MRAFSIWLSRSDSEITPITCPSATRSPSRILSTSRSPAASAVIWPEAAYVKVLPEAQARPPTEAVPRLASVRTPGLSTRMVTCRTRVPPGPTLSVAAMESTVPVSCSAVPSTMTAAGWPA